VTACSGKCGRPGAGPFDSGDPGRDLRYSWCDPCWHDLFNRRLPEGLRKDVPAGTLVPFAAPGPPMTAPELSALRQAEHKIVAGECKTVLMPDAPPVTSMGDFWGIANVTGVRDRQGDTTLPGSFVRTAGDLNAGRVAWAVTRQHTGDPAEVVAWIDQARETEQGLEVHGFWTSDPVAQQLRAKVAAGARLSLSITYLAPGARPDGQGGRILPEVDVTSIAITNDPASPGSYIRAGKSAGALARSWPRPPETVPVVDLYADAQQQAERRNPDRDRARHMASVVSAAGWPPPELTAAIGTEAAYGLIMGAAAAKAARVSEDDGDRIERERWQAANRYSAALSQWMAEHR